MYRLQQQRRHDMRNMKQSEGDEMIKEKTERLSTIFDNFNKNIQQFAQKYKHQINSDPNFRKRFNDLCLEIGIDPIVSRKSMWSDLGFGDFYNQLAMKVLDICNRKKNFNGGLMQIQDIIVLYKENTKQIIDKNDIEKAIDTLKILGNGCFIFKQQYVCTVPFQLSEDTEILMSAAEYYGMVSSQMMYKLKKWEKKRFQEKIDFCVKKGLVWIDSNNLESPHYYFASMIALLVTNQQDYNSKQSKMLK